MTFPYRPLGLALAAALLPACAAEPVRPDDTVVETMGELKSTPNPGETVREYDVNRDRKPDVWKYSVAEGDAERTVRKELDLNWDGRIDVRYHYAADRSLEREELDLDFDGRVDEINFYEKGQKVRAELDLDFDRRTDLWKHFAKGKLVRKERDTNADGKPDHFEYWEGEEIDRVGEDTDGDGVVDRWTKRTAT